jgi:hypothetical protein
MLPALDPAHHAPGPPPITANRRRHPQQPFLPTLLSPRPLASASPLGITPKPQAEDVAIAHGYNNIARSIPATVTEGKELPMNQLTELLRGECAMSGFTEVLTWALVSKVENFDFMRRWAGLRGGGVVVV